MMITCINAVPPHKTIGPVLSGEIQGVRYGDIDKAIIYGVTNFCGGRLG